MDDNELDKLKMNISAEFLKDMEKVLSSIKTAKSEHKEVPITPKKIEWHNNKFDFIEKDDDGDMER